MSVTTEEKVFTKYPQMMDEVFMENPVTINIIPIEFIQGIERCKPRLFSSAKAFIEFIESEIQFWKENDTSGKLKEFSKIDSLDSAKRQFESALKSYLNSSVNNTAARNSLILSINSLSRGILYSKTTLAKALLKIKDEPSEFLKGFRYGILADKSTSIPNSISSYEGFIRALQYRKFIDEFTSSCPDEISQMVENIGIANHQYSTLNASYTESFHQQQERLNQIAVDSEQKILELTNNSNEYFAQRNIRCEELEKLYEEKLRLQAPAEYWETMEKDYKKSATWWMILGVVLAVLIVVALVFILAFLPNLFSEDSHWFEVFKNSAIITVATSILVYVLRTCIKMAISSFHLSRDAKERNKLTCFYLSLIEKSAVTDKERAIILNALFSRSDTGLLKGDSTPSMSANVTDLVTILNEKEKQ